MSDQKTYDRDNFLIASATMTDDQYEVLRKWLGGDFEKHPDCDGSYKNPNSGNIMPRETWKYRGTSGGYSCYCDCMYGKAEWNDWCDINRNKPPVISFEEFEKYILNNEQESSSMTDKTIHTDFPDYDFKISCGDRPEVRQWLKDGGITSMNGYTIDQYGKQGRYARIEGGKFIPFTKKYYDGHKLPHLTVHVALSNKSVVTGYTPEYEPEDLKSQIKELEEKLAEMREKL